MSLLTSGLNIGTTLVKFQFTLNGIPFTPKTMKLNGNTVITEKKSPAGITFESFLYDNNNRVEFEDIRFDISTLQGNFFGFSDLTILETLRGFQRFLPIIVTTPYFVKTMKIENFTFRLELGNPIIETLSFQELPVFNSLEEVTPDIFSFGVAGSTFI